MHESEVFICKSLKGEAIVELLRAFNNAAYESLRLAPWVKIDEKKIIIPFRLSEEGGYAIGIKSFVEKHRLNSVKLGVLKVLINFHARFRRLIVIIGWKIFH